MLHAPTDPLDPEPCVSWRRSPCSVPAAHRTRPSQWHRGPRSLPSPLRRRARRHQARGRHRPRSRRDPNRSSSIHALFVGVALDHPYWPMAPGSTLGLPRDRRRRPEQQVEVTVTAGDEGDPRDHGDGRARPRHGGRRDRRGHARLVRAGRVRQPLVPRRGHEGVRERRGRQHRGLMGGRRRRRAAGHHPPGRSAGRNDLSAGVLRRARPRTRRRSCRSTSTSRCRSARSTTSSRHATSRRSTPTSTSTSSTRAASDRSRCVQMSGGSSHEVLLTFEPG